MRYQIELSYNGTNYHGWQLQPNVITVQEVVNNALSVIMRQPIYIEGCGRTDAGVHAKQYFGHFDSDYDLPDTFLKNLNGILPIDIAAHGIQMAAPDFNARFNATSRTYEYLITFEKNPFYHQFAARLHNVLDIEKMIEASNTLIGIKDFSSFSKVKSDVTNFNCNLMAARWYYRNDLLVFEVTANRFLRNMVRAMVGTLIQLGEGRIELEKFIEIVESKDRRLAGVSAPACGLYLVAVEY